MGCGGSSIKPEDPPTPAQGRTENLGKKIEKSITQFCGYPPPRILPTAVHRGSEVFSGAVRWVSSPHSPSHPTPAVQLLHSPNCVALDPQRRSGGGQGHHQSACQA